MRSAGPHPLERAEPDGTITDRSCTAAALSVRSSVFDRQVGVAWCRCAERPPSGTSGVMHRYVTRLGSLVLAATLGVGAVAWASPSPRPTRSQVSPSPRLTLHPVTVPVAGRLTFVGRGFRSNEKVWLGVGPPQSEARFWGWARANNVGLFRRTLSVKPRVGPGRWVTGPGRWIALACQRGCRIKAGAPFRIVRGLG